MIEIEKAFKEWEYSKFGVVGLVDSYSVARQAFLAGVEWKEKEMNELRQIYNDTEITLKDKLTEERYSFHKTYDEAKARIKELERAIKKHKETLKSFYPDNPKWYDAQCELYKLLE